MVENIDCNGTIARAHQNISRSFKGFGACDNSTQVGLQSDLTVTI